MKRKIRNRYSRHTKENVVNELVNGELWLEEAMVKYQIHDSRTVVAWLRKYIREKKKNQDRYILDNHKGSSNIG